MIERWLPIAEHPGYEVSDLGRVRSVDRVVQRSDGHKLNLKGRVLRATACGAYLSVMLPVGARRTVHRLVAKAFLTPDAARPFTNHKDGDKTNNCATNLEWCTKSENALHSFRVLGQRTSLPKKPVAIGGVRYDSLFAASNELGVSAGHIHSSLTKGHRVLGMEVCLG